MGLGTWMAVAGRDVAVKTPRASHMDTYLTVTIGERRMMPCVARNRATQLDMFERKFGGCCGPPRAASNLRDSALRLSGFRGYGSRLSAERHRVSSSSADFPSNLTRKLVLAAQDDRSPSRLSAEVYHLVARVVAFVGPSFEAADT